VARWNFATPAEAASETLTKGAASLSRRGGITVF
jgi:hypothetical protein